MTLAGADDNKMARHEAKIDTVAAMMDAFIAFKLNREAFE